MEKEKFKSRLGFILVSAGCAVGLGNVWKFPYICGAYGGAVFISIYLLFLIFLGLPILVAEFSVGRATQKSAATAFDSLEKPGTKWHLYKYFCMLGSYMLMFFYTCVAGWMPYYAYRTLKGEFMGKNPDQIGAAFGAMLGDPVTMLGWTLGIGIVCFGVCSMGLRKGVEEVNKKMMSCLLLIMVVLAVHSFFLEGADKGVEYYLVPDFSKLEKIGPGTVIYNAMSHAFFTLSIGCGSMHIFGCSIGKERSLVGESLCVVGLDTFVALMAGFIIIPACFAFNVAPNAGPGLIFITLPNIFAQMSGGIIWGGLFFIFMTFAAASTLIAVYENLIVYSMELFNWSRKKSTVWNMAVVLLCSIPCVLGFNLWSGFTPLGPGSAVLDLEDFIVSFNCLPLGSLGYLLFVTSRHGWGWDNFLAEANAGQGLKFGNWLRGYVSYVIPCAIIFIYVKGYYDLIAGKDAVTFYSMMAVGAAFLAYILYAAFAGREEK